MASNRARPLALLPVLVVLCLTGCATPQRSETAFRIGETSIPVRVLQKGRPVPTMVNVHDDENTSVTAGQVVIMESGGRLIELAHDGHRFITFELEGECYRFDPNRIFTEDGIRATLTRRGNYSGAAHAAVRRFAAEFLETFKLNKEPVIIALHNTGGGGLSINSYQPSRELDSAAARVHEGKSNSAGDFFYATDARFFDWLQARDYNVMLQDNATVPDDGSLSVYFARRGVPYLNIEADNNHLSEQIEMVRAARQMLKELGVIR